MSNSSTKMDVDNPSVLKRSSSAPMINDLSPTMTTSSSTVTTSRESTSFNFFASAQTRTRRYSASFSPLQTPGGLSPRLTPRVNQLRQEECIDAAGREVAHEREVHSAMIMSQSWEDLRLVGDPPSKDDKTESSDGSDGNNGNNNNNNKTRICDPLQLSVPLCSSPAGCSSPSPTRMLFRQTFSPTTTQWKTLSPSPTRKQSYTTRRSSSPMRPSSLIPVKRKCEMDESEPPAKRAGGLLIAQSRLDITESPVTGSLSSVGTPESISSGDSPGGFMDMPTALIDHPMQDLAKPDPSSPT